MQSCNVSVLKFYSVSSKWRFHSNVHHLSLLLTLATAAAAAAAGDHILVRCSVTARHQAALQAPPQVVGL
ncbi:hypothetical protein VNO78_34190 [Psophocarpus tetragonolobus]|uniref:Uncharacterized protein n=1 Tax=Psophocarpus tetragonolobus TaxID=3891 RepID=A0AAN9P0M3_PSOTE